MESISDYKVALYKIASDDGIVGDHVDLIVNTLAYSLYTSDLNNLIKTRESSITSSVSINSKIKKSMDRMYSVFRGVNNIIELDVLSDYTRLIEQGEELFKSNDFNLYSLDNVSLTVANLVSQDEVDHIKTIRCYVSKNKYTEVLTSNEFYVTLGTTSNSIDKNISSELILKYDDKLVATSRFFRDHLVDSSILFNLTSQDYGVRLYKSDKFEFSKDIEVSYYEYFDDLELITSKIDSIKLKGLKVKSYLPSDDTNYINPRRGLRAVPRESKLDIEYGSSTAIYNNSILRSNTDILHLFNTMYPTKIKDSSFLFSDGSIKISYIPVSSSLKLYETDKAEVRLNIRKSYYIEDDIKITEGTPNLVPIRIEIFTYLTTNQINEVIVTDKLSEFESKLGVITTKPRIISSLSRITNVDYVNVTLDEDLLIIGSSEFIQFNPTIEIISNGIINQ